jgi:hypothetical protein
MLMRFSSSLLFIPMFFFMFSGCDPKDIENVLATVPVSNQPALSNDEVVQGLREALKVGAQNAVKRTSAANGFLNDPLIRIPFPPEAEKVKQVALNVGLKNKVDQFEATLNHAAEKAAAEAVPVFVDAITNMSLQDGFAILKGDSVAATRYLREHTTAQLTEKFRPIVNNAIQQVNLTAAWEPLANAYNTSIKLTGGQPVNPDLSAFVLNKAMDGLFLYVSKEETNIRKNPAARVSAILQKVFGSVY